MKTLLLGLDGATFSILDPLIADGVMPFMGKFIAGGARADLRTIVPALTPPAWTSLMTGRSPGHHGVFDFFRMQSAEDRHIRFTNSNDVNCETIWSMASRNGLKIASLNFPLMFPAPKINGTVIPGWVPWQMLRMACHPPDLFKQLKSEIPGFNPREMAMDLKLEEKATEGCEDSEYEPWIELHHRREDNWFKVLEHLLRKGDNDLVAVVFDGVDKLQHLCWRFIDPSMASTLTEDWEKRVRDLCLDYFRHMDGLLEKLCELAGPETNVFMASDHGFGPTTDVFHINAWLEQKGYLVWSEAALAEREEAVLGVGQVARHTYRMDWSKTTVFATTPTANGLYIVVDRNGSGEGIAESEYEAFRDKLRAELMEVRDPQSGTRIVQQIWTRDEAFAGPNIDVAPDLTLELHDGGLVSILPSDEVLKKRDPLGGAHRAVGVFMANGPSIRKDTSAGELSILDVAPSILYSLGLAIPESLEGRVPEQVFEPAEMAKRPVEFEAGEISETSGSKEGSTPAPAMSREDEAKVVEQLKELGYIE